MTIAGAESTEATYMGKSLVDRNVEAAAALPSSVPSIDTPAQARTSEPKFTLIVSLTLAGSIVSDTASTTIPSASEIWARTAPCTVGV